MADFEPDAITFSATNALFLAQASQAAYMDEASARAKMAQLTSPDLRVDRSPRPIR